MFLYEGKLEGQGLWKVQLWQLLAEGHNLGLRRSRSCKSEQEVSLLYLSMAIGKANSCWVDNVDKRSKLVLSFSLGERGAIVVGTLMNVGNVREGRSNPPMFWVVSLRSDPCCKMDYDSQLGCFGW